MEAKAEGGPAAAAAAEAGSEGPVAQQGGRAASGRPPPGGRVGSPPQGAAGDPARGSVSAGAEAPATAAPSTDGAAAVGGAAHDAAPLLDTQVTMILDLPQFLSAPSSRAASAFLSGVCSSVDVCGNQMPLWKTLFTWVNLLD